MMRKSKTAAHICIMENELFTECLKKRKDEGIKWLTIMVFFGAITLR